MTDAEANIYASNPAFEEITGYPKDEILGLVSYKLLLDPKEWPSMEPAAAAMAMTATKSNSSSKGVEAR